ncbi:MAG: tetratricopeptide repeat protein [Acidobacteria bacterium]|nr:tetratricopeptide repeat protein [Acidobacteriota bacterium]
MSGREWGVIGIAAAFSVAVMGWIIWSEQPPAPLEAPETSADARSTTALGAGAAPEASDVDPARVATLEEAAAADPDDAAARSALGDLYFEARQFAAAIPWYEEVLTLDPADADSGASLGVSYFYDGQAERAVEAFDRVLAANPEHPRTLLSLGIVKAFGLQDLDGAREAWEQVIAVAPGTPESGAARDAIERMGAAHGGLDAGAP